MKSHKSPRLTLYLAMLIAFASCGKDRSYNNPVDPANVPASTAKGGTTTTPDSGSTSDTCLSATCSPPANTVYDFQTSFNLTPSGCSSVTNIRMFDTGSGLTLFFDANCGVRQHVYSLNASYTGTVTSASTLLTADCTTSTGVNSWDVAKGITEYMLVYSCKTAASAYNLASMPVTLAGGPGTSVSLESVASNYPLRAAWNGTAAAYGMVRAGLFRRLTTAGVMVGGSIATNGYSPRLMSVVSGNWVFVSGSPNSSAYCSKVNSSASLQCNGVSIDYGPTTFLDGTNFISTNNVNNGIQQKSLELAGCTAADGNLNVGITNPVGGDGILDALSLSSSLGAASWLTTSSKALIVGTFSKATAANIYSEASVANYTTSITDVHTQVIQNKIYVAYAIDGAFKINYSTQNTP